MGYIGNQTSNAFSSMSKQDITGNGGANYTLTYAVANENEIEVFVNNVRQEPLVAYTVNDTALTMTGNVSSTDDFYVIYIGKALQTTTPPDGSVSTAKLANNISVSGNFGIAGKTNPPASPTLGDMWFNSSTSVVSGIAPNAMAVYNGTSWSQMSNKFSGTGGTETTYTSGGITYKVHTFLSSSTFTVNSLGSFDSLIIAGGGGGGASGGSGWQGGGGGAGGYITTSGLSLNLALGSNTVTVGTGGASANNGLNSVLGNQTAIGGGAGGQGDYPGAGQPGASGGSGGGGGQGTSVASGGAGTAGQGFAGGASSIAPYHSGGGGGSGGSGNTGSVVGEGGVGTSNSIRAGTPVTYASGGSGANENVTPSGAGGANTGNGGQNLLAGGSGIVIIRYAI
jgi:hypothetical protein